MTKYIDAEKLKKIVEQAKQRALKGAEVDEDMYCDGRADAFGEVLLEIDSLQQERPSLPSDLDEAAEEYGRKEYSHAIHFWDEGLSKNKPEVMKEDFIGAFKAGAEWMAGQGITVKKKIGKIDDGVNQIPTYCNGFEITELDVPFLNSKECGYGDEVIVQIRKKQ